MYLFNNPILPGLLLDDNVRLIRRPSANSNSPSSIKFFNIVIVSNGALSASSKKYFDAAC